MYQTKYHIFSYKTEFPPAGLGRKMLEAHYMREIPISRDPEIWQWKNSGSVNCHSSQIRSPHGVSVQSNLTFSVRPRIGQIWCSAPRQCAGFSPGTLSQHKWAGFGPSAWDQTQHVAPEPTHQVRLAHRISPQSNQTCSPRPKDPDFRYLPVLQGMIFFFFLPSWAFQKQEKCYIQEYATYEIQCLYLWYAWLIYFAAVLPKTGKQNRANKK